MSETGRTRPGMARRRPTGGVGSNQYRTRGRPVDRAGTHRIDTFATPDTHDPEPDWTRPDHKTLADQLTRALRLADDPAPTLTDWAHEHLSPDTARVYTATIATAVVQGQPNVPLAARAFAALAEIDRAWHARGRPAPAPVAGTNRIVYGWDEHTVVKVDYGGDTSNSADDYGLAEDCPDLFAETWGGGNDFVQYQERVTPLDDTALAALGDEDQARVQELANVGLCQIGRRADGLLVCYDSA